MPNMGKPPDPPDYQALAEKADVSSHGNQVGPWGSLSYAKGADGQWTGTTTLPPGMREAIESNSRQVGDSMSSPLDFSGAPQVGNGEDARNRAEQAIYSRQTSRLDPMWQQREESQKAQLAAQGLDPSSEAGSASLGAFGRDRNDAYSGAMNSAIMGGGAEASRQQGMDMNARNAYISELLQKHNQPLQDMAALKGQPQFPRSPPGGDFLGAGQAQGRDQMAQYQAMMQMYAALIGGGASLAGAGVGAI